MEVFSINSLTAFKLINEHDDFYIIDVRTKYEWANGIPDINNLYLVSWRLKDFLINQNFIKNIKKLSQLETNFNNLLFLCKSGVRSMEAANYIAKLELYNCYNIMDGFEGNNFGLGWKGNNLPYCLPQEIDMTIF